MFSGIASPSLAIISYRIATEPNFIQKLGSLIKARMLESGQIISEEEASALKTFLEQGIPFSQTVSDWIEEPGELDTWIA